MRIILIVRMAIAMAVRPAHAKEQVFAAQANGQITFVMPSGNIGCIYTPKGGTDVYEPVDGGPEILPDPVEHRAPDRFLVGEVAEEGSVRERDAVGDRLCRDALGATLARELDHGGDDLGAARLRWKAPSRADGNRRFPGRHAGRGRQDEDQSK